MASASGLYELPTILHLLQLILMQIISKKILLKTSSHLGAWLASKCTQHFLKVPA